MPESSLKTTDHTIPKQAEFIPWHALGQYGLLKRTKVNKRKPKAHVLAKSRLKAFVSQKPAVEFPNRLNDQQAQKHQSHSKAESQ